MHFRKGGTDPGRDGCRVPLPWSAQEPYAGFGATTAPWLPQPAGWAAYAADLQADDPESMLSLYREALRLRRTEPGFDTAGEPGIHRLTWLDAGPGVLVFARTEGLLCVVNLAPEAAGLPAHTEVLLASGPLDPAGRLPQDTAVWLRA